MSGSKVILLSIVAVLLTSHLFAQRADPNRSKPTPNPPPPVFVEPSVPDGKAIIFVYRTSFYDGNALLVLSSGGPLGVLSPSGYIEYVTEPGSIKLWIASTWSKELTVEAVAGQIYYLAAGFSMSLGPIPNIYFETRSREAGIKEIVGCNQVN